MKTSTASAGPVTFTDAAFKLGDLVNPTALLTMHPVITRLAMLSLGVLAGGSNAQAAGISPVLADAAKIKKVFGSLLFVLMLAGFVMGVIKCIQGGMQLSRGEEGMMNIIGGAFIALAPSIMYFIYTTLGYDSVALDVTDINGGASQ